MREIFVREKEMPQNCDKCPLKDLYSDFPNVYCNVTDELINDGEDIDEKRHSTCPLKILKSED